MTDTQPNKTDQSKGMSLLQGLSILAVIGIVLALVFKYLAG